MEGDTCTSQYNPVSVSTHPHKDKMLRTTRSLLVLPAPLLLLLAAPASCAPQPLLEMAPGARVDTWSRCRGPEVVTCDVARLR